MAMAWINRVELPHLGFSGTPHCMHDGLVLLGIKTSKDQQNLHQLIFINMSYHIPSSMYGEFTNCFKDLTGQVVKTGPHCFAFGGNSDIWKGLILSDKDSAKTTVRNSLLVCWHSLKLRSALP